MTLVLASDAFDRFARAVTTRDIAGAPDGLTATIDLDDGRALPLVMRLSEGGVVRVSIGDRRAAMTLPDVDVDAPVGIAVDVRSDDETVTVTGDRLGVCLHRDGFAITIFRVANNETLWRTSLDDQDQKGRLRVLPLGLARDGEPRLTAAFEADAHDHYLGFGEKFCAVDKRGLTIESVNRNAYGATSERAYKNVPFFLSPRGYGLFINTSAHLRHDVVNPVISSQSYVLAAEAGGLEFFLIDGPEPKTVLKRYSELTGFAPVPPLWSFGVWISRFYFENWESLEAACDGMRTRDLPADVVNVDTYWMAGDRLSDLQWDEDRFPDPAAHLSALRDMGYRFCVWEYPYLSHASPLWQDAWDNGYLVRTRDGEPADVQTTLPVPTHHLPGFRGVGSLQNIYEQKLVEPGTLIDFTNPAAVAWWQDLHRARLADGVAVFKTDFGEDVPADAVFHDGRTAAEVHNIYPLMFQKAAYDVTLEVTGEHMIWGRSGWAGGQKYPVHWGGDPTTTFLSMAGTLRGALSYGLSGVPFWSHDVGGFAGTPDPTLYARWAQFGLFSSHVRCHGCTPREPWEFGGEAEAIFRRYAKLRYRMLPYYLKLAHEAAADGLPLMRHMALEFPDDPSTTGIESQYMLGADLLVAPVFNDRGDADVYLPAGRWADWWTGELHDGGRWLRHRGLPLDVMPLYLREGGVIPLLPDMPHSDAADWSDWTFVIHAADTLSHSFAMPAGGTLAITGARDGAMRRLTIEGDTKRVGLRILGETVAGADIEFGTGSLAIEDGAVTIADPSSRLTVALSLTA